MNAVRITIMAAAVAMSATLVSGESPDLAGEGWTMLGINRATGDFWRYDFEEGELATIGKVKDVDGNVLTGIDASAYFEQFQQVHAFWPDPSDGMTKMLRVDTLTGLASLDVINLGTGKITGAVAHTVAGPDPEEGSPRVMTYHIYALQDAAGSGDGVAGGININPNNSPHSEFSCTTAGGVTYTRDDLHMQSPINADGVFYEGGATSVLVKPKGNGNQNSLVVNGVAFPLANANTYTITSTGNMQVRIQNDKPKNGKAMGHWWIDITADTATITTNGGNAVNAAPTAVSDLIRIDLQTRDVVKVKTLARSYDCLASTDGVNFLAVYDNDMYAIDAAAGTETIIKSHSSNQNLGLDFAGSHLLCFEIVGDRLMPINAQSGAVMGFPIETGMVDLGTITFAPTDLLPDLEYSLYD